MSIEKLQQGLILPTKVVVREIKETEKVSKTGLLLIENKRNPQTRGKIVLVGTGTPNMEMIARVGLIALFTPLSAQKFIFEDEEFLLLEQSNILFLYAE